MAGAGFGRRLLASVAERGRHLLARVPGTIARLTAVPLLAAGVLLAGAATPAYAITPFNGLVCGPGMPGLSVTVPSSPPSTATVTIRAGYKLTITITGATTGKIVRKGPPDVTIIDLPGTPSAEISNPGPGDLVVTLEVPPGGDIFDAVNVPLQDTTIAFTCAQLPAPPPPDDPLLPPSDADIVKAIVDAAVTDMTFGDTHRHLDNLLGLRRQLGCAPQPVDYDSDGRADFAVSRSLGLRGGAVAVADLDGDGRDEIVILAGPDGGPLVQGPATGPGNPALGDFFAFDPRFGGGVAVSVGDVDGDGVADVVTAHGPGSGPRVQVGGPIPPSFFAFDGFSGGVFVAAGDVDGDGALDAVPANFGCPAASSPPAQCPAGMDCSALFGAPEFTGGVFVGNFAPQSQPSPALSAMSSYFDLGATSSRLRMPLQAFAEGWQFDVTVDGDWIARSFAALDLQTWKGSVRLGGSHLVDAETVIGLGATLRAGTTQSSAPAGTVNSMMVGADIEVLRLLSPQLYGGLLGAVDLGMHNTSFGGATGTFTSGHLAGGAALIGDFKAGDVLVTPSVIALVDYTRRNGFTDSAGLAVPGGDAAGLHLSAGVELSRDVFLAERDLVLTPFAGVSFLLDYVTGPGAPAGPADVVTVAGSAGLRAHWAGGGSLGVEARVTKGAATTGLGASASLSVPLD